MPKQVLKNKQSLQQKRNTLVKSFESSKSLGDLFILIMNSLTFFNTDYWKPNHLTYSKTKKKYPFHTYMNGLKFSKCLVGYPLACSIISLMAYFALSGFVPISHSKIVFIPFLLASALSAFIYQSNYWNMCRYGHARYVPKDSGVIENNIPLGDEYSSINKFSDHLHRLVHLNHQMAVLTEISVVLPFVATLSSILIMFIFSRFNIFNLLTIKTNNFVMAIFLSFLVVMTLVSMVPFHNISALSRGYQNDFDWSVQNIFRDLTHDHGQQALPLNILDDTIKFIQDDLKNNSPELLTRFDAVLAKSFSTKETIAD